MAASAGGILTLAIVVGAGPLAWAIVWKVRPYLQARAQRRKTEAQPEGTQSKTAEEAANAIASKTPSELVAHREQVSGVDYLMSLLGYAIGIGNLWRFPYLVGTWGGGAFVLAYLVCLFFVAMPAFLFEMGMGQYTRMSTINCFRMIHPRWAGLGYAQAVLLFLTLSYYNILLAYAAIYIGGSLIDPLPWASDSEAYWNNNVLNNFGGNYDGESFGGLHWPLVIALLFVWVLVYLSLAFGKEVLARVTWVTVVGPILMLAILLVRALTLEGAGDGIKFYIGKFDGEVLGDPNMWAAACGQILFSLSPGFGTAITLSSYTRPNQNVYRTCLQVAFSNSLFSLIGGFAIFGILGNSTFRINEAGGVLNETTGHMVPTTVDDQARAGAGLAFIVIADAMGHFGAGANVMSVLFFCTLFTLGLDSTFAWTETFVSYVEDFLEIWLGRKPKRAVTVGGVSLTFFVLGLFYCTRVGIELLDIVDHSVASYLLLLGVAVEAFLFTADFGWSRLATHVKLATFGNPETPQGQALTPSLFWRCVIPTTVPLLSLALFANLLYSDAKDPYGPKDEPYPEWMQTLGWTLMAINISIAPVGGLWHWYKDAGSSLPPLEEEERKLAAALAPKDAESGPQEQQQVREPPVV
jgi:SNF family Na+-dependent transporter